MLSSIRDGLTQLLGDALRDAFGERIPTGFTPSLERPRQANQGDIACNAAMVLAKSLGESPRALAQKIILSLPQQPGYAVWVEKAEAAGPGFINLYLSPTVWHQVILDIDKEGDSFGHHPPSDNLPKVLVEFVSANPTGPLHVGHGRQAVLGDVLCRLLETQGYSVTREFYYNDAGVQIESLTRSVQARARGLSPGQDGWPENAYHGSYIADIAKDFMAKASVEAADQEVSANGDVDDMPAVRSFAVAWLRREQDQDLRALQVSFDNYYLESSLYREGRVTQVVEDLRQSGKTWNAEGALWLRTTDYGDDKDRVMQKSDGTYTYFVPDIAYHLTKWERGFTWAINIQGSDHYGTMARVRAGLQIASQQFSGQGERPPIPTDYPAYLLHKMVTVMRGGEEVKISKRTGDYISLSDLLEMAGGGDKERGRDVVRFFLLSRRADTEFVFDVDLALKNNDENPVHYVQYATARIASVLREWGENPAQLQGMSLADLAPLQHPLELQLLQKLSEWEYTLREASLGLAPHQIVFYVRDIAALFHSIYNERSLRVLTAPPSVRLARLILYNTTLTVLRSALGLMGVRVPERM